MEKTLTGVGHAAARKRYDEEMPQPGRTDAPGPGDDFCEGQIACNAPGVRFIAPRLMVQREHECQQCVQKQDRVQQPSRLR